MGVCEDGKRWKTKRSAVPTGDATQMAMDEDVDEAPPTHEAAPAVQAARLRVGGGRVTVPQHSVAADREAAKGAEDVSKIVRPQESSTRSDDLASQATGRCVFWNAGSSKNKRWRRYAPEVHAQILKAFQEKPKRHSLVVDIEGCKYTMDFTSMRQIAHHTGHTRQIRVVDNA